MNRLYIIFFYSVLFINVIFATSLNANSFKITNLEISEPFDLKFNKEKVDITFVILVNNLLR